MAKKQMSSREALQYFCRELKKNRIKILAADSPGLRAQYQKKEGWIRDKIEFFQQFVPEGHHSRPIREYG